MRERVFPRSYYEHPFTGKPSEREYERIEVVASVWRDSDSDSGLDTEKITLHMDPETGMVLADVFAYEAWRKQASPGAREGDDDA